MRLATTMPDNLADHTIRARTALALGRLAHALIRLTLAAVLFGLPAGLLWLLWRWLTA